MTTARSLDDPKRTALLNDLTRLKADDDDAVSQDPKWFLPLDAHSRALRLETLVVRGGRGAGKSALFHFLGHARSNSGLLASIADASAAEAQWVEGFSSAAGHPHLQALGEFATREPDHALRFFWFGWLCIQISRFSGTLRPDSVAMPETSDPAHIADFAKQHLNTLGAWLDRVEQGRSTALVVTYDSLDRITGSTPTQRRLSASLLGMWLSLSDRYRFIRPKVFVREDLFQGSLAAFPDASKLDARSVSLDWRVEDLYRVLIKHMANTSPGLADWLQHGARRVPLHLGGPLGLMPPRTLPEEGMPSQKAFVAHLAGEQMGAGAKKGLTYRWIPNRLQDAHARAVPRSILGLIRYAAELALQRGPGATHHKLLTPAELMGALEKTSKRRAAELTEEFRVVSRLENLRKRTVMLKRDEAVRALAKPGPGVESDEYGNDGHEVLQALTELGVASERSDGRIDIPDIYRYGFGILRKGGVKRPR